MSVEEVKMYRCTESGNLFKTKALATKNANKIIKAKEENAKKQALLKAISEERARQSDYVRLNLSDLKDLPNMLVEKAKEFYNIDLLNLSIKLYFSESCSNTHNCPINGVTNWGAREKNKPNGYPGWTGRISATIKMPRAFVEGTHMGANDVLFNNYSGLFKGFYTSTGCGGAKNGSYPMDIGFGLFLEDFPLLQDKYNIYKAEKEKVIANEKLLSKFNQDTNNYVKNHSDYIEQKEIVELALKKLESIYNTLNSDYRTTNEPDYLPIANDYDNICSNFRGY